MQRRLALQATILVIGAVLILPVYAYIYSQSTHQVTQTILNVYSGVETVQVTGSIPNQMDNNVLGFFGAIFWNPTSNVYQITKIEFSASGATNQVFSGVGQGSGLSYPISGWALNSTKKAVYVSTTITVAAHNSQELFVQIKGNAKTEAFSVDIRITANGTIYSRSYQTREFNGNAPFSVLWLGSGTTPQFVVQAAKGTQKTFYVSLQECANKLAIGSNGRLTINLPTEFTNIQSVGGTGWGTATITGNKIEVNNTATVKNSYITYAFNAVAPTYKGLYMVNVSYTGTPNENPVGNFSVRVMDVSTSLLYVSGFDNADHGWTTVGSSPWLNSVDYPTNYVHTAQMGVGEGWFSFQDMPSGPVVNATLDIYGWSLRAGDQVYVSVWDGGGSNAFYLTVPTSPGWFSADVSNFLTTQTKVNAAMLWIYWAAIDNNGHCYVDSARLRVNG